MPDIMPDIGLLLPMIALLVVIGAIAGIIAGLLGVGGGIVLVPAFFYTFTHLGYSGPHLMQVCVATSLATIAVTSVRSVLSHHRKGAVDWAILKSWAPFIAVGATAGVITVAHLSTTELMGVFATIGTFVGLYMGFGKTEWRLGDTMPRGIFNAAIGAVTGFFSVLMGVGGGSFAVPLMTLYGVPIHRAVATSAGVGMINAVPSVILFLLLPLEATPPLTLGAINLPAWAIIIAATMITAPIGVRLSHAIDPKPLKRIFAGFITLVALNMLRKFLGY